MNTLIKKGPVEEQVDPKSVVQFRFDDNWVYTATEWIHALLCRPSSSGSTRGLLRWLFVSESFWSRFSRAFLFLAVFFHLVPLMLANWENVAFPSSMLKLPFLFDLTEYAFTFGTMVLAMSRNRFSRVQNDVLEELVTEGIFRRDGIDGINEKIKTLNNQRSRPALQATILLLSLFLSLWLMHKLLSDNLASWHGKADRLQQWPAMLDIREIPTACGLYVSLVVWPASLYLIFNGALNGLYWLYFMYWVTRKQVVINAFHPDECGGLHPLKYSVLAWSGLIIAVGVVVVMDALNYTNILGAPVTELLLIPKIIAWLVGSVIIFLGPMWCLTWQLFEARRDAERKLAPVARRYGEDLQQRITNTAKRLERMTTHETPPFDSAFRSDVEHMAYEVQHFRQITSMKLWPLDLMSVLQMAGTVGFPLALLLIPKFHEILIKLHLLSK